MNQRIDETDNKREFTVPFLPVLVLLTVVALLVIIPQQRAARITSQYVYNEAQYRGFSVFPWVIAGGQSLANGLMAFSGKRIEFPLSSVRMGLLAGLLVAYVVCPTVFLFVWRDRRLGPKLHFRQQPMSITGLVYGICGVITLFIVVTILPIGLLREKANSSLRYAQTIQSNKDALINTINEIVIDMKQYRILPKKLGGGEGSCNGYTLPPGLAHTNDGALSATVQNDSTTIDAQSLISPSSRIVVTLSPKAMADSYSRDAKFPSGGQWQWTYEGEFR